MRVLHDPLLGFDRFPGVVHKFSGFLLSLLSPMLRITICGPFAKGLGRRVDISGQVDTESFLKAVDLGIGRSVVVDAGVDTLLRVGKAAEFLQMDSVREAVEDELVRRLTVDTCGELRSGGAASGLWGVEKAARALALYEFGAFAKTAGFLLLAE